jgi:hypothetical protein
MLQFKSVLAAAFVAMALAFQPGAASAQTIGMGGDGYTRGMWHATDGSISIWKLDPGLNFVGSHAYGPYAGWSPLALTTTPNNNTYVLWRFTDGTANLWQLDANLNFVTARQYGPIAGWTPAGLAVDNYGNIPLLWQTPQGQIAVWLLNPALNPIGSVVRVAIDGYGRTSLLDNSSQIIDLASQSRAQRTLLPYSSPID